tara:strand:+ start:634 stop:1092 length:459 start_codon:yes stop_codon:yes gene_type:complete
MSTRTLSLKWRTTTARIDVPVGESPVTTAARHFGLVPARTTLVFRGKRYRLDDAVIDAADDLFGVVGHIMVLGTPAHQQLDAPSRAAAVAQRVPLAGPLLACVCDAIVVLCVRGRDDWVPALARGLVAVARGIGLFFTSLVPRPSRARRRAE